MEEMRNTSSLEALEEQAMQGSGEAAMELARRYAQGCDGAEQDPNMADYWKEQAAQMGYQPDQPQQAPAPAEAKPAASRSPDDLYEEWKAS